VVNAAIAPIELMPRSSSAAGCALKPASVQPLGLGQSSCCAKGALSRSVATCAAGIPCGSVMKAFASTFARISERVEA